MRLAHKLLLSTACLLESPVLAQQAPTALSGPTIADPAKWPAAHSQGLSDAAETPK